MLAYRIVHKQYSSELFASGLEGRWNSPGRKVVYCAESVPLAFLENLVRRQGVGFNQDFKIMFVEIPAALTVATIDITALAKGWRNFRNYSACQPLGDDWYDRGVEPIMKVPSAVVPEASNLVLNAVHPDFPKIRLVETSDLVPDARIGHLLKNYPRQGRGAPGEPRHGSAPR